MSKIEALNCPNCGASVASDSSFCRFCGSRLKTAACAKCLGLMFVGAKHCTHCGEPVVAVATPDRKLGKCPRCAVGLEPLAVDEMILGQCVRCDGLWIDVPTFERVCADQEKQAAVLRTVSAAPSVAPAKIQYVPCPDCTNLMNRSNFARSSGVIIDTCKQHGIWCDADELPKIIEFIRAGGIDRQRDKEKIQLDERRREIIDLEQREARRSAMREQGGMARSLPSTSVREFLKLIFD